MIVYIIAILFVCFHVKASEQYVDKAHVLGFFNTIPIEDQKEIKSLFKNLFFNDVLSYSLFGDKPISFSREIFYKHSSGELVELLTLNGYCQSVLDSYCEPSSILEKRWNVWEKHKNNFKLKNIFIRKAIGKHERVLIINKNAFKKIFNKNIQLFKEIIGDNISAEDLLAQLELDNRSVFDILHDNEGLLGILLGFGKHNAMLFQKREELLNSIGKNLKSSELIQDQIKLLDSKLQALHEHDPYIISTINRVGFAADPTHLETIRLRQKYDKLNKKLNDIYSQENWFEQTLLQLIEE